jgi:hypothetical protein
MRGQDAHMIEYDLMSGYMEVRKPLDCGVFRGCLSCCRRSGI